MFFYFAYGLDIRSNLPLPELVPGEKGADVTIRLGRIDRTKSNTTGLDICLRSCAEEVCLYWEGVGGFLIQHGCEIIIDPAPGVEEGVLRHFILGPTLAVLLHQRGLLVLHASTIAVNGTAIAFLGESGQGKSTLAAAFYTRGHSIVTDDVTAIQVDGEIHSVLPGFPQLKLLPGAAASLRGVPKTLPQLHSQSKKRVLRVTRDFSLVSLPIRRIYVLAEGQSQKIEVLQPQEAFKELVRHSYVVHLLEATGSTSTHLCQCVSLASRLSICRLERQRSLSALPILARIVEEDLDKIFGERAGNRHSS